MRSAFALLLILCALFLSVPSAWAEESQETSTFPPECEFSVSFPEKPYVTHRCKGRSGQECYDILTYTRVFDLSNTVTVKATCNLVDPSMTSRFSEEAMKETLESMVSRKSVGQYDVNFSDRGGVRSATLFGEGVKGVNATLYVAQLWLAQSSLLTVEAELTGDANPQADMLFRDILKSIRLKGSEAPGQNPESAEGGEGKAGEGDSDKGVSSGGKATK